MLIGETTGRLEGERVPINIADTVRTDLRSLLFEPQMRGVGYSEFIWRAIQQAREEIKTWEPGDCTGSSNCGAYTHIHGCHSDYGKCDQPFEHLELPSP